MESPLLTVLELLAWELPELAPEPLTVMELLALALHTVSPLHKAMAHEHQVWERLSEVLELHMLEESLLQLVALPRQSVELQHQLEGLLRQLVESPPQSEALPPQWEVLPPLLEELQHQPVCLATWLQHLLAELTHQVLSL